ncbi:prisilkin-39 [Drosophila obscura]|uniref:prisilkin-39 n=1 Tax=Drosophila obscura TaxID=7282 RepID=UPI001BB22EC4|nr:prisilkin-39 [Drosophila obscura]
MNSITLLAIVAASCLVAMCAGDVSHLSRSYLPPQSIGYNGGYSGGYTGYNSGGYSAYPRYSNGGGYYSGAGAGSSYASPLISSSYRSYVVPQYTAGYAAPSSTYLPADTGYSGYNGLDTKYASNGGYVY